MSDEKTIKEIHDAEHDSVVDPQPDCELCAREVIRRTQRCFGDGSSNTPSHSKKRINDLD